ncbi:TPA: B12-binding domain-containing radical SAM protein [bacterium]|nr:B12-binding domain-containing radical SAM protein [bacterium]
MKVLLINPPDIYAKKGSKHYPLGLGYLATTLNQLGEKCEILDLTTGNISLDKKVSDFNPDIIGVSVYSTTLLEVRSILNSLLPKYNGRLIAGGPHATLFPKETLSEGFNYVVKGEGEETLPELLKNLHNPKDIKGVAFKQKDIFIENPNRPKIKNLDEITYPDRTLFDLDAYKKNIVMGARGCSNNCNFCSNWQINGGGIRRRSPHNIFDELRYLSVNGGYKDLFIADDNFGVFRREKIELCDLIINSGINIDWAAQMRVDFVDKQLLEKMRAAGCSRIYFGVESGNQEILDNANKRTTVSQSKIAIKLAKDVGMVVKVGIIIGLPGTYKQNLDSLNFIKETLPEEVSVHHFVPFPGTEYWNNAEKYGIKITDKTDFSSLYYHTVPKNLNFDYISKAEIVKLFQLFNDELKSLGYVGPEEYSPGKKVVITPLTRDR